MYFHLGHVFEITQTSVQPTDYPKLFPNRRYDYQSTADTKQLQNKLTQLAQKLKIAIKIDQNDSLGDAKGSYSPSLNRIQLNPRNTDSEKSLFSFMNWVTP